MIMLIAEPDKYIKSVTFGLQLFAVSVLPSLFPFFFFSKLLSALGAADAVSRAFGKPVRKLFRTPPIAAYIFVMSIMSGYPIGARLTSDFYAVGAVNTDEARRISAFASTSGPLFIVGTVGACFLLSRSAGFVMLAGHYFGALLNGLLYRIGSKRQTAPVNKEVEINTMLDYDAVLSESISSAVTSVAAVGGYIAIFGMIIDMLSGFNVFALAGAFFGTVGGEAFGNSAGALLISLVEMTRGTLEISKLALNMPLKLALCGFAAAFGGACVFLQSYTYLSKCKVKVGALVLIKLTQASITFFVTWGLASLIPL
ncbi:MAG: hypothetical protein LBT55_08105 [Clostridiaceae bacterium]|jgi:sporulation integral membrane protein YlbJ|nr:hypothetical protein [Clostridiaceae bacterium]